MTLNEQINSVQTAIATIESGAQAYSLQGRQLTRADLGVLYTREKELLDRKRRQERGGIRISELEFL